jgi:hypothetical protein
VTDYSDLKAMFVNCTLKRSPGRSNTEGLVDVSKAIMEKQGVEVEVLRAIDHDIAIGVWPDMREHGWATDAWPEIYERVMAAELEISPANQRVLLHRGRALVRTRLEAYFATGGAA